MWRGKYNVYIHNCSVHCIHTMLLSRTEDEHKMSVYHSYLQIFWSAQNLYIHRSMHHHNVMYILLSPGAICSVRNGVSWSAILSVCGEQKQESFDFLFMRTRLKNQSHITQQWGCLWSWQLSWWKTRNRTRLSRQQRLSYFPAGKTLRSQDKSVFRIQYPRTRLYIIKCSMLPIRSKM